MYNSELWGKDCEETDGDTDTPSDKKTYDLFWKVSPTDFPTATMSDLILMNHEKPNTKFLAVRINQGDLYIKFAIPTEHSLNAVLLRESSNADVTQTISTQPNTVSMVLNGKTISYRVYYTKIAGHGFSRDVHYDTTFS